MDKLEELRKIELEVKENSKSGGCGVWELLKSIHSNPASRQKVGFEAVPLVPYLFANSDGVIVAVSLLAVPLASKEYNVQSYIVWKIQKDFSLASSDVIKAGNLPEKLILTLKEDELLKYSCETAVKRLEKSFLENGNISEVPEKLINVYKELLKEGASNSSIKKDNDGQLTEKILKGFNVVKSLIIEENLPFLDEWKSAYKSYIKSDFYTAVVGEFSTGKSTLINKMLQTDILPVGDLPTTALLTRISYGAENSLTFIGANEVKEQMEYSEASFDKHIADLNGADPEGVLDVTMNNPRLKDSGVYIFDTPGAGDVFDKRAKTIVEVLTQCDGVFFTISAIKPLSASERTFMQQYIISQKTPHICVVLTMLDKVEEQKRINVVKYLANEVKKISPSIDFAVSSEDDCLSEDIKAFAGYGYEKLWSLVNSWVKCEENLKLRNIRAQTHIQELIKKIEENYLLKLKLCKLQEEKKNQVLKELNEKLSSLKLIWTDIELEIDKCKIALKNWLYEVFENWEKDMLERFNLEIKRANDPKGWYENEFKYRIQVETNNFIKSIEGTLEKRFFTDIGRINEFIKKKFSTSLAVSASSTKSSNNLDNSFWGLPEQRLASINDIRWALRVGTGIATMSSYLFLGALGPVGIVVSITSGLLSDRIISKKIDKQGDKVRVMVNGAVKKIIKETLDQADLKLNQMYKDVAEALYNSELSWLNEQQKMINHKSNEETAGNDEKLEEKLTDKLNKLNTLKLSFKN